jgi:hypothetical protein
MVDELGWFADLEVGTEHAEVDRESVEGLGAGTQQAGVLVDHLQQPHPGRDPLGDRLGRRVQAHLGAIAPSSGPAAP